MRRYIVFIFGELPKAAQETFLWAALVVGFIAGVLRKRRG